MRKKNIPGILFSLGFAAFLPLGGSGAPLKIQLPAEIQLFKPGQNVELANAQCLTCHSVEYVTTQPPLSRNYWKSAVEKMQQKFGAPIASEQIEPLVEYLFTHYGASASSSVPPAQPASIPPAVPAKKEDPPAP